MRTSVILLQLLAAIVTCAPEALAQYMYLDSNGDGVHTSADTMNPNGTPTPVDVWIRTDANRDGSPAVCHSAAATPLTIQGYRFNLEAVGGTVTYSGFVNQQPTWTLAIGVTNDDGVRYSNGFAGSTPSPPGAYRLASLVITGQAGAASIRIVDLASTFARYTGFFCSDCDGYGDDGWYKLDGPTTQSNQGSGDWFDADGLASIVEAPPPVLSPIGDRTTDEGALFSLQAAATDPSGSPLSFSLSPGGPAGASITPDGLLTWTPTEAQGPNQYFLTVIVSNGTTLDLETFRIWVNEVNTAPVLSPIGDKTVNQGSQMFLQFSASDSDLPGSLFPTQLSYSLGADAPEGMYLSFGGIWWVPTAAGSFPLTVIVTDNGSPPLSDSETITITVLPFDGTPVLNPIGNRTINEGARFTLIVSGTDPGGDQIGFMAGPGRPEGFSETASGDRFFWIPSEAQGPGVYPVTIIATDGALTDSETIQITVLEVNQTPYWIVPPSNMTVNTGTTATQQVSAFDPDIPANTITYAKTMGPAFVTVSDAGLVTVSPAHSDAGTYTVNVRAFDGLDVFATTFQVTAVYVNQAPVADAGGPYSGFEGALIHFDGQASVDPDGDPLSFAWDFGDGSTGTGAAASHSYVGSGVKTVVLTVSDEGGMWDTDTTTASVVSSFPATVFSTGGSATLRLGSGKPDLCVQIEPASGDFEAAAVDPATVRLYLDSRPIVAIGDKTTGQSDRNRNGVSEVTACFSKDDLRNLFAGKPTGDYDLVFDGLLTSGGKFVGAMTLPVVSQGGLQSASVTPNPLNPNATLTFATSRPGSVQVELFDVQGRSVRVLEDESSVSPGYHDVEIDGYDAKGARLASGIYYVRIRSSADGEVTKAVTILK
ncbi:MAG TPA: PKD domain-containing protein [Candidatus Eisenbacteria bacterium]|nr:PKD domain-containing protein [Candidatus Eisenbacteria bacterium]